MFRVEDAPEEQEPLWAGAVASQAQAVSMSQAARTTPAGSSDPLANTTTNTAGEKKAEPIRNMGQKVGRNDPRPCGSGKKYKNCHMKMAQRM